jgi:hypothetical protein
LPAPYRAGVSQQGRYESSCPGRRDRRPTSPARISRRALAEDSLGQAFVIENKPGRRRLDRHRQRWRKSPGDGYTLLAASSGPISIMPNLQKTPYDPLKDIAPVERHLHQLLRAGHPTGLSPPAPRGSSSRS